MNLVGHSLHNLGKFAEAETALLTCLKSRQDQLGESDPKTIETMLNIAKLYKDNKSYENAVVWYTKVLELKKVLLGIHHHPEIHQIVRLLVKCYKSLGNETAAQELTETYLTIPKIE